MVMAMMPIVKRSPRKSLRSSLKTRRNQHPRKKILGRMILETKTRKRRLEKRIRGKRRVTRRGVRMKEMMSPVGRVMARIRK